MPGLPEVLRIDMLNGPEWLLRTMLPGLCVLGLGFEAGRPSLNRYTLKFDMPVPTELVSVSRFTNDLVPLGRNAFSSQDVVPRSTAPL